MLRSVLALLAAPALGLAAAGCGSGDGSGTASAPGTSAPAATQPAAALPAGCRRVAAPHARGDTNVPRPTGRVGAGATAQMRTNCGTFAIRLATDRAPKTASSFAGLVRRGFYDGLTFHRIAGDAVRGPFVIQGGDPLGTGLGGPGFSVVERPPADLRYTRYTVAMAKTATEPPGASGSQFFVVTASDAHLPRDYALVGRVTSGKDVVDRIAKVPTDQNERPVAPVVIERATLRGGS